MLKRLIIMRKAFLPKLDLELLSPGVHRQLVRRLVLAIGLLLVITTTVHYFQTVHNITVIETGLAQPASSHDDADATVNNEEVALVQNGITHLALPWGKLFGALEATPAGKINLISVEPNAGKRSVTIVAEAPDVYEMLEYVRELAKQTVLKNVLVGQYETLLEDENQPVRFTLTAIWSPIP